MRHEVVFLEPGFGAGAVAGSFLFQQLFSESFHGGRHFAVINGVTAGGGIASNRPLLGEVVEFHHFGAAVGLAGAKAHGAEEASDVGSVVLLQARFGQGAVIHQPFQTEHADSIGLGLFQFAVGGADGLADIGFAGGSAREGRAQAMGDFVQEGAREVAFAAHFGSLVGAHHAFGHGEDDVVHARVHEILEEDFLCALDLVDAGIIGQIVGDGLVAVAQVAGAIGRVHHLHGGS